MIRPVDVAPTQMYGDNPTSRILPGSPDYWIIELYGNYQPDGHAGEDYPCKAGTPVRAVTDGTVLHIGRLSGTYADNPWWIAPNFAGYVAVIDHGAFIGIYGHCTDGSGKVKAGDRVTEGQVFVLSGNTGASTGDHLHFEILPDGYVLNSRMYGRTNPEALFTGIQAQGTITPQTTPATPTEEIDMSAEENILARITETVSWQNAQFQDIRDTTERNRNALAAFVRDVVTANSQITAAEIDAKFAALATAPAPAGTLLYKGKDTPDVYAWDGAKGFRHIGIEEYVALTVAGANLRELDQAIIDALPKEG